MCPSFIEIGSKTAEKNSAQTNRQTNRHYENNGHLAVNQKLNSLITNVFMVTRNMPWLCVCPSITLSVTSRSSIKTAKHTITQKVRHNITDSGFLRPKSLTCPIMQLPRAGAKCRIGSLRSGSFDQNPIKSQKRYTRDGHSYYGRLIGSHTRSMRIMLYRVTLSDFELPPNYPIFLTLRRLSYLSDVIHDLVDIFVSDDNVSKFSSPVDSDF